MSATDPDYNPAREEWTPADELGMYDVMYEDDVLPPECGWCDQVECICDDYAEAIELLAIPARPTVDVDLREGAL